MKTTHRLLVLPVLLLVAGLVFLSTDASRRLAGLESAEVVFCDRQGERVVVAMRGQGWILDESGRTLGHLLDPDGGRAGIASASSIGVDDRGRIWVVEHERNRIRRFLPGGGFDAVVLDEPGAFSYRATVLPLRDGRFAVSSVRDGWLRLYDAGGRPLREQPVLYPNDLLAIPGGLAVLETGTGTILGFDEDLEPMAVPEILVDPPHEFANLKRDSMYEIDLDRDGALYFSSCPDETRCKIFRRRPPGPAEAATAEDETAEDETAEDARRKDIEWVAAHRWFAEYDPRDPSYSFCATTGGHVLLASRTFDAVLRFEGAVLAQAPSDLTWDMARSGIRGGGVRIGVFGDRDFLGFVEEGRRQRAALEQRVELGRTGLGIVLTLLMAVYVFDRLLGQHGGLRGTWRRTVFVVRRVLWPDRRAIVIWALPAAPVLALAALAGLVLARSRWASPVEALVLAIWTSLWLKRLVSPTRLAGRRRAATARQAFRLFLGEDGRRPLPPDLLIDPQLASFVAPAGAVRDAVRGDRVDTLLERAVSDDPFEILEFIQGGLHLVTFGDGRLIWHPCQLSGKPRGRIRAAKCKPVDAPVASTGDTLDLPDGRFVGAGGELVGRLSSSPSLGPITELCEECGREIAVDPRDRCPHYRKRGKLALVLAALLPGLGHLALRKLHRGRWLAVAAVLLLSRMLYLAIPVLLGTGLFHPTDYLVPGFLYALVWWISCRETREEIRRGKTVDRAA